MILVTGNPRSGTKSMSLMMRDAGYDVGHEAMGKDGTSSSLYFIQPKYGWPDGARFHPHRGEEFNLAQFKRKYLVVRDPLSCIPSMAKVVGRGHSEWLHENDVVDRRVRPKIKWAATAWLRTNEIILSDVTDKVIRIEHVLEDWPDDLTPPPLVQHKNKASGYYRGERMTKAQLREVAPDLMPHIRDMARRLRLWK